MLSDAITRRSRERSSMRWLVIFELGLRDMPALHPLIPGRCNVWWLCHQTVPSLSMYQRPVNMNGHSIIRPSHLQLLTTPNAADYWGNVAKFPMVATERGPYVIYPCWCTDKTIQTCQKRRLVRSTGRLENVSIPPSEYVISFAYTTHPSTPICTSVRARYSLCLPKGATTHCECSY